MGDRQLTCVAKDPPSEPEPEKPEPERPEPEQQGPTATSSSNADADRAPVSEEDQIRQIAEQAGERAYQQKCQAIFQHYQGLGHDPQSNPELMAAIMKEGELARSESANTVFSHSAFSASAIAVPSPPSALLVVSVGCVWPCS